MKTTDLRRSNAIYILRAIVDGYHSLEELASQTQMSKVAVKKILYALCDKEIIIKYINKEALVGRPRVYFDINPLLHCILIKKEATQFSVNLINVFGQNIKKYSFPLSFYELNETNSLKMLRTSIKNSSYFKYNLGIFLVGDIDPADEISMITKTSEEQLILDSLYDESLVIYCEIGNKKYLHNHGKTKEIKISDIELKDIIDLDYVFKINESKDENLQEALRLISLMKLEEKI